MSSFSLDRGDWQAHYDLLFAVFILYLSKYLLYLWIITFGWMISRFEFSWGIVEVLLNSVEFKYMRFEFLIKKSWINERFVEFSEFGNFFGGLFGVNLMMLRIPIFPHINTHTAIKRTIQPKIKEIFLIQALTRRNKKPSTQQQTL